MTKPIKIECKTHMLVGDIQLSLEPKYLTNQQKNGIDKSIESDINSFCRNFSKAEHCNFSMFDFINEDENVFTKNISVSYKCSGKCFIFILT